MKNESNLREGAALLDRICQRQETIAQAEQALQEQRQEMGRLLKDLKQKHQGNHGQCLAELEVLRMGNDCLQQLVAERDQQLSELTQRLDAAPQAPLQAEAETHLAELEELRKQVQEKDALIEQLQAAGQEPSPSAFPAVNDRDYEAELTEFRRQLETDRQELNEEIQHLRARNAELNDAARDAELQLSRERAQLARERVQLDRLREEIRQELERLQRDAGVRERLVALDRLKEEVAERQRQAIAGPDIPPPTARRKSSSSLTSWRKLLSSQAASS